MEISLDIELVDGRPFIRCADGTREPLPVSAYEVEPPPPPPPPPPPIHYDRESYRPNRRDPVPLVDPATLPAIPRPDIAGEVCGVYFLFQGPELVYLGQSVNVHARVHGHAVTKAGAFDAWAWTPCPKEALSATERAYLDKYLPRLNTDIITRKKRLCIMCYNFKED